MCGKVFKNRKQALSHWAQAHTVEATQDKMGAHIFKSCSIDLPIMSTVGSVRVGMIQMVAYLEDLGSMTNEDVEIARKMYFWLEDEFDFILIVVTFLGLFPVRFSLVRGR